MNVLERLKVCSTCKNKEFDPSSGVVCSLTKRKPVFEESCVNYAAIDNSEAKEVANAIKNSSEQDLLPHIKTDDSVSGWLAFFLYVVVGAGAILGVIATFSLFGNLSMLTMHLPYDTTIKLLILLPMAYSVIPLAIAIATIVAFSKRDSNAVSLANTYLATSAIYGIVIIILGVILGSGTSALIPSIAIAKLVWCGLWFIYLATSHRVATIIPAAKRTWKSFEKWLMAAAIVLATIFTLSCIYIDKSLSEKFEGNANKYPIQNIERQGW